MEDILAWNRESTVRGHLRLRQASEVDRFHNHLIREAHPVNYQSLDMTQLWLIHGDLLILSDTVERKPNRNRRLMLRPSIQMPNPLFSVLHHLNCPCPHGLAMLPKLPHRLLQLPSDRPLASATLGCLRLASP